MRVPAGGADAERGRRGRGALKNWYRGKAAGYLPARLARWAAKLGVALPKLLLREPVKRWGSCDGKGNLRINWRTIQVAPRLIDYVLAHELVHLEHRRHDADFWARLGEVTHPLASQPGCQRRADAPLLGAQVCSLYPRTGRHQLHYRAIHRRCSACGVRLWTNAALLHPSDQLHRRRVRSAEPGGS